MHEVRRPKELQYLSWLRVSLLIRQIRSRTWDNATWPMRSSVEGRPLGALLVAAAFLTACASPLPVKGPSTSMTSTGTIPDETTRYLHHVREEIKKVWTYPCVPLGEHCEYKSAVLDVEIHLLESGQLQQVTIVRSSGIELYDVYAANAIRLAAPYPPVPPGVMATMKHQPEAGAIAALRAGSQMPTFRAKARFTYSDGTGARIGVMRD